MRAANVFLGFSFLLTAGERAENRRKSLRLWLSEKIYSERMLRAAMDRKQGTSLCEDRRLSLTVSLSPIILQKDARC